MKGSKSMTTSNRWWWEAGLAVAAATAAAGLLAGRLSRGHPKGARRHRAAPAAFASVEGPAENFVQIRGAGPQHMRDYDGRAWTDVDQGSDESFPASDPPSCSMPHH